MSSTNIQGPTPDYPVGPPDIDDIKSQTCTKCAGKGFVRSSISTPLIGIDEDCQHCAATGKEPAPPTPMTPEELDAERLTDEEVEAACDYLDQRHILERHSEDLYYAARQFTESLSKALSSCDGAGITLGQLATIPLIDALQAINLDLYNKGLRDKP